MKLFSYLTIACAACCMCLTTPAQAFFGGTEEAASIGVVNFKKCAQDSKLGNKEREVFENTKKLMASVLDNMKKDLDDLAAKFKDSDYLDSLSEEAEAELKNKFHGLSQEIVRYENQYYHTLNQANQNFIKKVTHHINEAARTIAEKESLSLIVDSEPCFFYLPAIDVTVAVLEYMDDHYKDDGQTSSKSEENTEEISS
jgi:outer membrane protein